MKRIKRNNSLYNSYNQSQSIESESKVLNNSLDKKSGNNSRSLPGKTVRKIISQKEADEIYKRLKNEADSRANYGT